MFSISCDQLSEVFFPQKSQQNLNTLGGVEGLLHALKVDPSEGLKGDYHDLNLALCKSDFAEREKSFGCNRLPPVASKSLLRLLWDSLQDNILRLLMLAGTVSLVVGILQATDVIHSEGSQIEWVEGCAILVTVFVVALVSTVTNYQREKQFRALNLIKDKRSVNVLRNGVHASISVFSLLVGDILLLQPGDIMPCDAVFIDGQDIKADESGATGESDAIHKGPKDQLFVSGSKILEGTGRCLVVAVGVHSFHGHTFMSLRKESPPTPLESQLGELAENIAKVALVIACVMAILLAIVFGVRVGQDSSKQTFVHIFNGIMDIITKSLAMVVVAVPEGLPFAVLISLGFATSQMAKENNLVRILSSCEVMANTTTVCSDKTGTLTQNKMSVVKLSMGLSEQCITADLNSSTNLKKIINNEEYFLLFNQAIAVNSTAFLDSSNGPPVFVGSKTEVALLDLQNKSGQDVAEYRKLAVVKVFPFSSSTKWMGTIVEFNSNTRFFIKGASEVVLNKCTKIYNIMDKSVQSLTKDERTSIEKDITSYENLSLRTICIAYKENSEECKEFIFLALFGIEDPLRVGVREAVQTCQNAGVFVRMVTGDNVVTARAISRQAGILQTGGLVLEGQVFRKLSKKDMERILPRLQVLARSSPSDKEMLVKSLKEMDNIVAVTGDGTNDAPAMKMADVSFSMGIAGTEVAKEASSIVLLDDNFSSIVRAILWGRTVNDSIRRFLQFQLTVNVAAVITAFCVNFQVGSELMTPVQLLWVNVIMDSFAALAYATEPPCLDVLKRHPDTRDSPLITRVMLRMIISEATLQVVIMLPLFFVFSNIKSEWFSCGNDCNRISTFLFNTFIYFQLFNEVNCRVLDSKLNVFKDLYKSKTFIGLFILCIVVQALIVEFPNPVFNTTGLTWYEWVISILLGFSTIICGLIVRLIPIDKFFFYLKPLPPPKRFQSRAQLQWANAIGKVRAQLSVFRVLRGGKEAFVQ